MTSGSIFREIIVFSLPIIAGNLFQNLYNSVDSIVVGNSVGTSALAAVTSSADITKLLVGFFTGLSTGSGVVFARLFGAKQNETLHKAIHTAISFAMVLGLSMALTGILISPYLLKMVHCPEDVYSSALSYLRIYFIGIFFTAIYNVAAGVLQAVGDSRHPFYYLITASITNILLDLLFVTQFDLGVKGVAIATILSQLLSLSLIAHNMITADDVRRLAIKELHIDGDLLKNILLLGLPAGIQTAIVSFSNLFVQAYGNKFGSSAMAGIGVGNRIDNFVGLISMGMGLTVTTFIGQNMGAKKPERAFKGLQTCLLISFAAILVIGLPIYFNASTVVGIFTKDSETIALSVRMIRIIIPLFFLQCLHLTFGNAIRGFGRSITAMITSMMGVIVCRQIFLAVSMHLHYTVDNVIWSYPVGWASSACLSIIYYLVVIRIPYLKDKKANSL